MPKIKELNTTNSEYDSAYWVRLRALYEGGKFFRRHIREFLPQNMDEPDGRYGHRLKEAAYENHVGPIIDYFSAWLFSMSFSVKAKNATTKALQPVDEFYAALHAHAGRDDRGAARSLSNFVKSRTTRALAIGASWTVLEKPAVPQDLADPQSLADYNAAGLDRVTLRELEREQVLNWSLSEDGAYDWVVVHAASEQHRHPILGGEPETVEQWRIYDRQNVSLFEIRYKKGETPSPEDEAKFLGTTPHGFLRVPVICFELPAALRAGERTYEPQLEHFRLKSGLSWSVRQTCYAMPVINCESDDAPPRMGVGYYIQLGPNDKFGWTAPPAAPFDVIQKNIDAQREEIYRVNHSMAQALDNNAETVGRSADSKNADTAATRIVLGALGEETSRFVKEIYETLSEARGETEVEWSVEGFSGYDTATAGSLIGNAEAANRVGIPSKTFRSQLCTKIAMALLPEADQAVKDTIRSEIEKFDFTIHDPMSAQDALRDAHEARATLDDAKAAAEPIKAKAAAQPKPQPNGGPKAPAPQPKP